MSQFRYTGRDAQGGKVSGTVQGASSDSVASELLAQKITPLTIEEQAEQGDGEDVLAAICAAVSAYLGNDGKVQAVRFAPSETWVRQGRRAQQNHSIR